MQGQGQPLVLFVWRGWQGCTREFLEVLSELCEPYLPGPLAPLQVHGIAQRVIQERCWLAPPVGRSWSDQLGGSGGRQGSNPGSCAQAYWGPLPPGRGCRANMRCFPSLSLNRFRCSLAQSTERNDCLPCKLGFHVMHILFHGLEFFLLFA